MKLKKVGIVLLLIAVFFIKGSIQTYAVDQNFNFDGNLPNYYTKEWLNNIYNKVKTTSTKGVTSFAFVTDTNLSHNSGYSASLIKNINKQSKLDFVVNGGNFGYIDPETMKNITEKEFYDKYRNQLYKDYANYLKYTYTFIDNRISSYYVKGNHDLIVEDNEKAIKVESRKYPLIRDEFSNTKDTMQVNKYEINGPDRNFLLLF